MTLSSEVIEYALRSTSDAKEAALLLAKMERIREAVKFRDNRIKVIQKRAEKEIDDIMSEKLCLHEIQKGHSDPSGGSDRSTECLICGEIIHERPVRFT